MRLLVLLSLALTIVASYAIEPLPDAEYVCNRTENVKKERLVQKPVEYKIIVNSMCGFLPCKKTITETLTNITRETYYEEVIRRECCDGYAITPELTCAPICLRPCKFGKCVAPNSCECSPYPKANRPGYMGPQCNRFVCSAPERWGPNCDKECQCSETEFCDAITGKCICRPGWRGTNCSEECDQRSQCDDLPFWPVSYEPEVNVFKVDSNVAARMSALSLEKSDTETDNEDKKAFSRMLMAHLHINLFLVILLSGLMFTLFCYRKKINQLRNEIYYAAYPGSDRSNSSDPSRYASVYDDHSTIRNRPRMQLPGEPRYLSKNLDFNAATRNILNGKEENPSGRNGPICIPINSKLERHLVMSKEPSEHNIYSDIESNLEGSCVGVPVTKDQLRVQCDENEYQVPRSPARPMNETNSHNNLYEELVPNSSAKADGKE